MYTIINYNLEVKMPVLNDFSKGLKKGVGKAEKGIKKGIKGAKKGFKDISEKAGDSVKAFELNNKINKQEEKLKISKLKIGENVLALAAKGSKFDPELMKSVKTAEDIQIKIKEIKATIKKIKND